MGAEFVAMIAVLGSMKLAMVAGQAVMKGFHATMIGLGAAAGIAIGAIAGVLGAMRELNVAKMQPLFIKANGGKNVRNSAGGQATMQQFYGDPQLAGFGEQAISGAMTAQMRAGGQANGAFRGQLTRYGDFTGGDPKALQAISSAMSTAQFKGSGKMKGKISGDTYSEMQKSAPGMAEAFEEMAGGADKANAAAAGGKISFDAFNKAIMEGKLKSLEPYNGALAAINNTVIMKLKKNLAGLKEQVTSIGLGSFKELYGPVGSSTGGPGGGRSIVDSIRDSVDNLGRSLKISLATVAPVIQKTMPGIVDGMSKPLTFLNEKLVAIITRGMTSLDSFDNRFNVWIGNIRNWFSQMAAYIAPFAAAWDTVWNALLKPLLSGVGELFGAWLGSINSQVGKGQSVFVTWGINIKELFHNFAKLEKSLNHFKDVMGPIISAILQFVNFVSKLMAIPFVAGVLAWAVGIKLAWTVMEKLGMAFLKAGVNLKVLNEQQAINNKAVSQGGILTDKQAAKLGQKNARLVARQENGAALNSAVGKLTSKIGSGVGRMFDKVADGPVGKGIAKGFGRIGSAIGGGVTRFGEGEGSFKNKLGNVFRAPVHTESLQSYDGSIIPGTETKSKESFRSRVRSAPGSIFGAGSGMKAGIGNFFKGAPTTVLGMDGQPIEGAGGRGPGFFSRAGSGMSGGLQGLKDRWQDRKAYNALSGGGFMNKAGAKLGGMDTSGLAMGGSMAATMAGGYISSHTSNTSGIGQGLGGALAGAGTGAMIGTMIAPGVGTAIGAGAGALIGGTMGVLNARSAAKDQQKKSAQDITGKIFERREAQTLKAVRRAEARAKKFKVTTAKINELTAKINGTSTDASATATEKHAMEKKRDALEKRLGIESGTGAMKGIKKVLAGIEAQKTMIKTNDALGSMVGVSADKLAGWADRNHKKLSKTILKLKDLQELTGYKADASDKENRAIAANRMGAALSSGNSPRTLAAQAGIDAVNANTSYLSAVGGGKQMTPDNLIVETSKIIDAIATRQSARFAASKDTYSVSADKTIQGYQAEIGLAKARGVSGPALDELTKQVNEQSKQLEESKGDFQLRSQMDPKFFKDYGEQVKKLTSAAIPANLKTPADQAKWISDNKATLDEWLKAQGILPESIKANGDAIQATLTTSLADNGVILAANLKTGLEQGGARAAKLLEIAMDGDPKTTVAGQVKLWAQKDETRALAQSIRDDQERSLNSAIDSYNIAIMNALAGGNQGLVNALTAVRDALSTGAAGPTGPTADTATPRFNRTLQSHGALDRMTSGKRTMTSGIRTNNLGSINSDHLTGRAYDLTGQNLGAYASNVKATGGFAEFHGTGGSRHLHVVPGAMGDTASPVGIGMGGPAGTVNNYNIVVNPPPGSSPEAIANEVMNRIAVRQRDSLERR